MNRIKPDAQLALRLYVQRLGDNALITGQRMIERVAGEPELEAELANANFALDYLGQARMYYSYAAELEGAGRNEDDFAYARNDREFQNFLLVEQPNGHFGDAVVRQVLFDSFYLLQLEALLECSDQRLAEIAARAAKEIRYHLQHVSKWLIRLGDGTSESNARVSESLARYWRFAGEFFAGDEVDDKFRAAFNGPDLSALAVTWQSNIDALLAVATLTVPADIEHPVSGGRAGLHSEHFGFLLAEMQHLTRSYPGATW
ncbi:MAG TPA: phenylacetate-CoA oxygenase subunit PaaC [Woeseiaceae bacterium]|nr:phenylacetate-CoA oxygenase subunit PaaC [Woeseiaceae bacterium]